MQLVLDNYLGGATQEVTIFTRTEYEKILLNYLSKHPDNFVSVRGNKSYTIELGADDWYSVYEITNPTNRQSMSLDAAIQYVYEETIFRDKN